MLKGLLYVCLILFSITCCAQTTVPVSIPDELKTEDTSNYITDLDVTSADGSKVKLTWKVPHERPSYFAIERSDNGKLYETVAILNRLDTQSVYQWIDDDAAKGRNFYRIRFGFKDGESLYSKTISALISGLVAVKFYPNPVDHVLIIRAESPVDVQITDANGKTRIIESRVEGLRTINVSSLEKGIYLIRFTSKLMNIISQEKLIKN
jgi:hypothetical protein